MIHFDGEDIVGMLCGLAAYRVALTDLNFGPDEQEDAILRDQTLSWVSQVLGPKVVAHVDRIEADLRKKGEEAKRNQNGN